MKSQRLLTLLKSRNVEDKIYLIDVKRYFEIKDPEKAREVRDMLMEIAC